MPITNAGYMLYIQACAKFWTDPAYRSLKRDLMTALYPYQFLGICAVMWRFVSPDKRRRWTEASNSKIKADTLKQEIATLARYTLDILH